MHLKYEHIITRRRESLFSQDLEANKALLEGRLRHSRIAVIGAAGSIGGSVVKTLLRYQPKSMSLIDLSENNLVEVVRDLRSSKDLSIPDEFVTLPIGLGSLEFNRYFRETEPFDYLFNLCAVKHVRSEKDIYCLARMIDTNVVFLHDFLAQNPYLFKKVFSVSSDKAANPANVMGASKMVMEKVLLANSEKQPFSTARFANVAFSDGSLPFGFLQRIGKSQPIAAPSDIRRYFISHQEASELCVLSCILGENRDAFFPKLTAGTEEKTFAEIAVALLEKMGYEPIECGSEDEAKERITELIPQKKWPCYFFKTDTTGEKSFEEFYEESEDVDLDRFNEVGIVKQSLLSDIQYLYEFLTFCHKAKTDPSVTKDDYVKAMRQVVSTFSHLETGKNLDQKM